MDGLARAVGNGITGLVQGAFDTIGAVLRGMVATLNGAIPFGLFPLVVLAVLLGAAWVLAKR